MGQDMTKRFAEMRRDIKHHELITFQQLLLDDSPNAFTELKKLSPEIVADILAAGLILSAIRPRTFSMTAPVLAVQKRIELGIDPAEAACRLVALGAPKEFSAGDLLAIERSKQSRDKIQRSIIDALCKLYGASWTQLCCPCSDEVVPSTR